MATAIPAPFTLITGFRSRLQERRGRSRLRAARVDGLQSGGQVESSNVLKNSAKSGRSSRLISRMRGAPPPSFEHRLVIQQEAQRARFHLSKLLPQSI